VAPWCMAQQFGTRIVAQVFFRKVWSRCEEEGRTDILDKYRVLSNCIVRSVGGGNASEQRITEDFYLSVFCPKSHLTVHDVLYEFPRLCNSGDEELVPLHLTQSLANTVIPLHNPASSLSAVLVESAKTSGRRGCEKLSAQMVESSNTSSCKQPQKGSAMGENVQRKITPWSSMH